MKNKKANTWQACYSRHRWCARIFFSFHLCEVLENEKWKNGEKGAPNCFFQKWFSERGHSRNGKWKSKHVASLLQPPPLMCACFFLISFVRSAQKWKMKKWGKRRIKLFFFKNDFQNEATHVMENKKQTRGKLVTAATVDVRVFFFHFFGEKCSKMKKRFVSNPTRLSLLSPNGNKIWIKQNTAPVKTGPPPRGYGASFSTRAPLSRDKRCHTRKQNETSSFQLAPLNEKQPARRPKKKIPEA